MDVRCSVDIVVVTIFISKSHLSKCRLIYDYCRVMCDHQCDPVEDEVIVELASQYQIKIL